MGGRAEQLLKHFERVGAVAAAAGGEVGGAELGVFGGVVGDAGGVRGFVREDGGCGDGGKGRVGRVRTSGWCRGSRRRRRGAIS